jgi:flagellar hook protein FlgE
MLSIIMSGLNVAQKDLQVSSNNMANANTVGFKRSQASFLDVFANDPSANPKTAVGTGAMTGMVERVTTQGAMTASDSVTDLAIAGKGFFVMGSADGSSVLYTRAGNLGIDASGKIVDSLKNELQVFASVDGVAQTDEPTMSALVPAQTGGVRIALASGAAIGSDVSLKLNGTELGPITLTATDVANGYVTFSSPTLKSAAGLVATYNTQTASVPLSDSDIGQVIELRDSNDVLLGSKTITAADIALKKVDFTLSADQSTSGLKVNLISTGQNSDLTLDSSVNASGATPGVEIIQGTPDVVRATWSGTGPSAGRVVQLLDSNGNVVASKITADGDVSNGYIDFNKPTATYQTTAGMTMRFLTNGDSIAQNDTLISTAAGQVQAATEYRTSYLQGVSINSKGLIKATYGDGSAFDVGYIALATFRNDSALKPTGNTNFIATGDSGDATLVQAGAPAAGDILSGTLEQANVDITQELMTMLRAQQVYNGNARMLQTAVEVASRITDKL